MEYRQTSKNIDPYSILLEEFHQQEKQNFQLQQYLSLLNDLKIYKKSKFSCIKRKKDQQTKLAQRTKLSAKQSIPILTLNNEEKVMKSEKMIAKIDEEIMLKEEEELLKILTNLKQQIEQVQSQLSIFNKKDSDIKRHLYESKRNLQHAQVKVKNQKSQNIQLYEKFQRQLDNLQAQKDNLEQQLKYIANNVYHQNKKKSGNHIFNLSKLLLNNLQSTRLDHDQKNKQEIYSKKKLESYLRICYILLSLRSNWRAGFRIQISQIQSSIKSTEILKIFSKDEILRYYEEKNVIANSQKLISLMHQSYDSLNESIHRFEKIIDQLNNTFIQLKNQHEVLDQTLEKLEQNKQKIAMIVVSQNEKDIDYAKKKLDLNCGVIFRFSIKMLNSIRKLTKIQDLCHSIIMKNKENKENKDKKLDKSFQNEGDAINRFYLALKRSPQDVFTQWNQILKNSKDSYFLERLKDNDMFRTFVKPETYSTENCSLKSQVDCSNKIFIDQNNLLFSMKTAIIHYIISNNEKIQQMKVKLKPDISHPDEFQTSTYLVESKEYYRRDNFKLLQMLERRQLKKRGLYIPPKFERSFDTEINREEESRGGFMTPNREVATQRQRRSIPVNENFLSSYRSKVNKADKKIRDLLGNLQQKVRKEKNVAYRVKKYLTENKNGKNHNMSNQI